MERVVTSIRYYKEVEGFPGIIKFYSDYCAPDGTVRETIEGDIHALRGTEFIHGGTCRMTKVDEDSTYIWMPSLVKNAEGEWMIRARCDTFVSLTDENIAEHGIPKMAAQMARGGIFDLESAICDLPKTLRKMGAFVTVTGARSYIIIGKTVVCLGCSEGFSRLLNAGIIDAEGNFKGKKLTEKVLHALSVDPDSSVINEILDVCYP